MSRIDYSNFDDSFDEGLYYFHALAEQQMIKTVTANYNTGYKDANTLIKNRMKAAAVIDKTTVILMIVKSLTDKLQHLTENSKEEIQEKLIQHQTEQFTYDQIVDDLIKFFDYDTIAASRFARTGTNYVYNQAHLNRYRDTGIVAGVRYAAHLDNRTSEICRMLNGTIWAIDDPNILTPPNHFNCCGEFTEIQTTDCKKNIEDIVTGDYVLTHEDRFRRVTDTMKQYSHDILDIKTESSTLQVTYDHPIAMCIGNNYRWIKAGELKISDKLFVLSNSKPIKKDKIISIIKTKPSNVFNFSVEEDESYTANGIVVHNCRSRILPYFKGIPGERDYTKDFEPEFIAVAEQTLKTFHTKYWDI